jgi:alkylation response protein AidB-like acyl-CoA dehydrogenase
MYSYSAPLRDMQFVIETVLGAPKSWAEMPGFADFDANTSRQVLIEAAKFAGEVLSPINSQGDLEGCVWRDGHVTTPAGYKDAYKTFVDGGWAALRCSPSYGGQGLPLIIGAAFDEMTAAANQGWTMYPGLLHGAYECMTAYASDDLKQIYLDKIVSGHWLATMNLTEPQAGSDLGAVRTKAVPNSDGSWAITGSKIFISGGEHDLTDNIVHLVLCRLPDAPVGSKGLSLLLAPKILPDGSHNGIRCDGIEKKMGIKGSATCSMSFEQATGWLIGEPHRGLSAMFVMMNSARLHVGLSGLGHLEIAYQNAFRYCQERVQGRGRLIIEHPSVQRTLWELRAISEGERVIGYWTAQLQDEMHHHPVQARRQSAERLVSVLTPVVKAFFTDNGHKGANRALQLWGGYGYVHDYGIEQTVRDSRIAMIYEGTNEIQAIDLLQRKVLDDGGMRLFELLDVLQTCVDTATNLPSMELFRSALTHQIANVRTVTRGLLEDQAANQQWPLTIADDFLKGLGLTLLAWAWLRTAQAVSEPDNDEWLLDKLRAARFGVQWLLPESDLCWARVTARESELPPLR